VPFRDVIQVDGIMVRDREQRLAKLFHNRVSNDDPGRAHSRRGRGTPREHAQHAQQSGAALGVLQQSYQPRFRFSLGRPGLAPASPSSSRKWDRQPRSRRSGRDLPARPSLGRHRDGAYRTELQVEQPAVRASITTTFQAEEKSGIAVPLEMRRAIRSSGNRVNSLRRFRRFDVNANEDINADRHPPT
jgi:hypothetical protein